MITVSFLQRLQDPDNCLEIERGTESFVDGLATRSLKRNTSVAVLATCVEAWHIM